MRLILFFSALIGAAWCLETFVGDQVLRVKASSEEQISKLQLLETLEHLQLDFWLRPSHPALPVDIRVPFASLQAVKVFLESHHIDYAILVKDLQVAVDEEREEMVSNQRRERSSSDFNYAAYHSLEDIYTALDSLAAAYPSLVSKQKIGETYEKRPMYILKQLSPKLKKGRGQTL
uniref:Carboxypeptidase A2 n=1 Tax=Pelusios castaneus TaxID=367368 RepID=A0A8C8SJ07_9SAUR